MNNGSCGTGGAVIRDKAEQYVLHTYNRFPVALTHGRGVRLYDADGREYLDFAAGIAVNALGHAHPILTEALRDQVGKLMHTSNLYYHDCIAEAAEKLVKASGLCKVFFTNSGAEAVEGALKAARKYAWMKDGRNDHEIIAMNSSFHGRTFGALSVTGNEHYQEPFRPMIGGIKFADFNDLQSVRDLVNDRTCAVILETVQGEGGIYPADPAFLAGVRELCDSRDILLILDEIQCGMGRCSVPVPGADAESYGHYAYQSYGVEPDILTTAKALGGGVPVGAFVLGEKAVGASLVPGDHGTTYGGNPLACRAVSTVFDVFEDEKIIEHVRETTPYLEEQLDKLVADYGRILASRRGMGFLQGLVVKDTAPGDIINKALEKGLLLISAGTDVLRLAPPLIAGREEIDEMTAIMREVLASL